jgi:hypothetical protein
MMLARTKILSKDGKSLKIWQMIVRMGMSLFLFIGFLPMLFDKKEKKSLHDIVAQTRVAYAHREARTEKGPIKKVKLIMVGMAVVLLTGLIVHGFGEKLTGYTENKQMAFFDLNNDEVSDGLKMDADGDGIFETFKYDLDNDHVVDFTTIDTDKDGIGESIDVNNDGRIDGFDFDNDNKLDIEVEDGQFAIRLWKIVFGIWGAGFVVLLAFGIIKENKNHE